MTKILYYSFFPDDASSFYRTLGVFPYIKSREFEISNLSWQSAINWTCLVNVDALIVQRPCEAHHYHFILLAKDMGVKVIVDYDDDGLNLDEGNPLYQRYEDNKPYHIECLKLADEIWASTSAIKESFSEYNQNIFVIPNAHNDFVFNVDDKMPFNPDRKVVTWRGGMTHMEDMMEEAQRWRDMINNHPQWKFKFFGSPFQYFENNCGQNYQSVGGSTCIQFYRNFHKENAPIFFYPLKDTKFNRSKSNIAFIESTYSGSAVFANKTLQEYDITSVYGLDMLEQIIASNDLKSLEIANNLSWEYIQDNLLLSHVNELRKERLLQI